MKVLVLDAGEYYLDLDEQLGMALEVVAEVRVAEEGCFALYRPTEANFFWIETQAKTDFDIIIVGNNNGAGLAKVHHIPSDQLDKVIVVWAEYEEGKTIPYRKLGIKHFSTRVGVAKKILEAIQSHG